MTARQALVPVFAGFTLFLLAGCSQRTVSSAQQDAQHNIAVVGHQADKLAQEAKPQLDKLSLGARVTTALQTTNLPHTIRVDADTQGVRLRGTVKTEAQRTLAGRVAQDTIGPDKTVTNQLTIAGS